MGGGFELETRGLNGGSTTSDQPINLFSEPRGNSIVESKSKFDSDLFDGRGTHCTLPADMGGMDSDGQTTNSFVQVSG